MKNFIVIIFIFITVCGCDGPRDIVINNNNMFIYHMEEREDIKLGKYEYWIRDNSISGWKLITDKKFNVGDIVKITN